MPKNKKHPTEMTTEELAKHVFHPKVLKHAKEHLKALGNKPAKSSKKSI
jgi:hypothetical protein